MAQRLEFLSEKIKKTPPPYVDSSFDYLLLSSMLTAEENVFFFLIVRKLDKRSDNLSNPKSCLQSILMLKKLLSLNISFQNLKILTFFITFSGHHMDWVSAQLVWEL